MLYRDPMVTRGSIPVVVVHWHRFDWCVDAVRSLRGSTASVRILVVDNGGDDADRLLRALPPDVLVMATDRNLGFAGGANLGLAWAASTGAHLAVVCAHDCQVAPDTVERLARCFEHDPRLGIAGPMLTDRTEVPPALAAALRPDAAPGIVPMGWVSGTMMMLRLDAVADIGGFDGVFGSYFEDVELCHRARRSGWHVAVDPGARAHGWGTGDVRQRDASVVNAIRLARLDRGWAGALGAWGRLLAQLGRWAAGSLHPGRTRSQRAVSRQRLQAAVWGLRRLPIVFRRPATGLPDHWPDPISARASG